MMEAARTSEKSVDNYFTRQYTPEDKSELHTHRRENLKSHILKHSPNSKCSQVSHMPIGDMFPRLAHVFFSNVL
jgi:hypothetical protein